MNIDFDRLMSALSGYGLVAAATLLGLSQLARGQEVLPTPATACAQQTCVEQLLERLGVCPKSNGTAEETRVTEFRFFTGEAPHVRQMIILNRVASTAEQEGEDTAKFLHLGCPSGATGECACANKAKCSGECEFGVCPASASTAVANAGCKCEVCKCEKCQCTSCTAGACKCPASSTVAAEAKCGEEAACGEDAGAVAAFLALHATQEEADLRDPLKLLRHIANLMAGKAAAEAELETRKEAAERLGEMFELMAEMMADNAALDAKLQAHAEQQKLQEKVGELAAENARLKANVELAAARAELQHASLSLTLENERLKLRLAQLENQQADAARTAAKPRTELTR